jgi:hypothetical protein
MIDDVNKEEPAPESSASVFPLNKNDIGRNYLLCFAFALTK